MEKLRPERLNSLFKVTEDEEGLLGFKPRLKSKSRSRAASTTQGAFPWPWPREARDPATALFPRGSSLRRAKSVLAPEVLAAHVSSPVRPGFRAGLSPMRLGAVTNRRHQPRVGRKPSRYPVLGAGPPGRVCEWELAKGTQAWKRAPRDGLWGLCSQQPGFGVSPGV